MESDNKPLENFLESEWPRIQKHYTKDFCATLQELLIYFLGAHRKKPRLLHNLQQILEGFSEGLRIKCESGVEQNCQLLLIKANEEQIAVFAKEEFSEAVDDLEKNFDLIVERSSSKAWKFAIACNLREWIIYGKDTMNPNSVKMKTQKFQFLDLNSPTSANLRPLIRYLITILAFDTKEFGVHRVYPAGASNGIEIKEGPEKRAKIFEYSLNDPYAFEVNKEEKRKIFEMGLERMKQESFFLELYEKVTNNKKSL